MIVTSLRTQMRADVSALDDRCLELDRWGFTPVNITAYAYVEFLSLPLRGSDLLMPVAYILQNDFLIISPEDVSWLGGG